MQQAIQDPAWGDYSLDLSDRDDGKCEVRVLARKPGLSIPVERWVTGYGRDLILQIFAAKGPYVCDEMIREEADRYRDNLFSFLTTFAEKDFYRGKRILDFGCGGGASSVIFARTLPEARVVGIDLNKASVGIAKRRRDHYELSNLEFLHSDNPAGLPDGLGDYDVVILNAVYEHLLPNERQNLMPLIWERLSPGGLLLLRETPYRWFPLETHTTGLPLINYLPDRMAAWATHRFSPRVNTQMTWPEILRRGIRGATVSEIGRSLKSAPESPRILMKPVRGTPQHELWYRSTDRRGSVTMAYRFCRAIFRTTGLDLTPYLAVGFAKGETP